jgi:uncharacterized protein YndB with AHSA1/START domain/DNA-binding transcriptional ArsR family regulator
MDICIQTAAYEEADLHMPADDVFRALADPGRRQLLDRLNARNGQSLGELGAGMGMARQSVSKHLGILEAANLVTTQWQGREKLHYLNPEPINAIANRWMTQYDRSRADAVATLKQALEDHRVDNAFVYTTYIKTTPDQLWTALTEPAFTKQYWGVSLLSDWKTGSVVTWLLGEDVTIDGENQVVLESDPPKRLSYTWHAITDAFAAVFPEEEQELLRQARAEGRTKVTFDLEPAGETVKLTVTHDDFDEGSVLREGLSGGWPSIISGLKSLLETGEALSIAEPSQGQS